MSVGNHFRIILGLIRRLGLRLLGHLGLGSWPLPLLGSRDLSLGLETSLDKLAADRRPHRVPLGVAGGDEGAVGGGECWMACDSLLLICRY